MPPSSSFLAAIVAALVLTAAMLPALDHHLAERLPGHSHTVLAQGAQSWTKGQAGSHTHAYERDHGHPQSGSTAAPAALDVNGVTVAALVTPQDGPAGGWQGALGSWIAPAPALPPAERFPLAYESSFVAPAIPPAEPIKRPPISAS